MRCSRILSKKTLKPEEQRELVKYAIVGHEMSERQACRIVNLNRGTYRYQASKTNGQEIEQELLQLSESQPRWGCRKLSDYLRNQGHPWKQANSKDVPWFGAEFAQKTKATAGSQGCTSTWGASVVRLDLVPRFYE